MIRKINLLWKIISEKLNDVSTPKNAGNSIAPKSIAVISHVERGELRKKGIKSLSKFFSLKYLSPASIKELNKNPSAPKRVYFVNSIVILSKDSDTEEDISSTNACRHEIGKITRGNKEVKKQGKEEDEMETNMEVEEVIEEEESEFESDEEVEEILEEDEDDENFNSFPTMKELSHHEWLLKNPRPRGRQYNQIMTYGLRSRQKPSNPNKISNCVGRVRSLKIFIGSFTYECDFMILEDATSIIDRCLIEMVFKRPFIDETDLVDNKEEGPYYARKDFPECHLPGEWEIARDAELNPFKDTLVLRRMVEFLGAIPINLKSNMWESEDLIKNPINWDKPPKNEDGAWHAKIRLINSDGEEFTKTLQSIPITRKLSKRESKGNYRLGPLLRHLYLMRRSLEVLRKFHWMILGGRFNQLSHVSSLLLSKPEEY
ncbi:hypothetical protein Tco_1570290 [Tanacetum coccineum]